MARLWMSFAFAALGLAFSLLIAELILRAYAMDERGTIRKKDYFRHHAFRAEVAGRTQWGTRPFTVTTNSLGMRDRSPRLVPKKSDDKRILIMGDSFIEGVGVEFPETVPAIVGDRLRSFGTKVEALNGGISSYSPLLSKIWLSQLLDSRVQIDRVLLFLDQSDVQDTVIYEDWFLKRRPTDFWAIELFNRLQLVRTAVDIYARWRARGALSAANTDQFYSARKEWAYDRGLFDQFGKKGVELIERDLLEISEMLKSRGIPLLLVVYPWLHQIERESNIFDYEAWISQFAQNHSIEFLNLFPDFRQQSDPNKLFFVDDVHWNPLGHRFVSEVVSERLKSDLLR